VDELLELLKLDLENEDQVDETLQKAKLSDKALKAVKGALRLLNAYKDELPKDILNTLARLGGYGYAEPEKSAEGKDDTEEESEDVKKMAELPEWARERIEALQKSVDDTNTALTQEIANRKAREFLAKAETFDNIPGEPKELAELLLKADAAGMGEALDKLLGQINTSMAEMYKQIGSDAGGSSSSVVDTVNQKAKGLLEKNAEIKSLEQAVARVLQAEPELYQAYLDESKTI